MNPSRVRRTGAWAAILFLAAVLSGQENPAPGSAVSQDGSATASFQGPGEVLITRAGGSPVRVSLGGAERCQTPVKVEWIDRERVGAACQAAPSLLDYFVVNAKTGSVDDEYAGAWFAWSPDHRVLAHAGVLQRYGTPAGDRYCLMFNQEAVYPQGCTFEGQYPTGRPAQQKPKRHYSRDAYAGIHTFYSPLVWSPDSRAVAVVEKTFDWEYTDPYNRDFYGEATKVRDYVAIIPVTGTAAGYPLESISKVRALAWTSATELQVNEKTFDLRVSPPGILP